MEPRAENWARAQFHYLLNGKPAGVPCVQLDEALQCRIFGKPERPACCGGLQPSVQMCGTGREAAMQWLTALEEATRPSAPLQRT